MRRESIEGMNTGDCVYHISMLSQMAMQLGRQEGLRRAASLAGELTARELTPRQSATVHYFASCVWETLWRIGGGGGVGAGWESPEAEACLRHLRQALMHGTPRDLPRERVAQVLTNMGAILTSVGRFSEGIECWDRALGVSPTYALARGRKGGALAEYAQALYDQHHSGAFMKYAHAELRTALSLDLYDEARSEFAERLRWIERQYPGGVSGGGPDLHGGECESSEDEALYRRWCLQGRLFLNPLNDLGPYPFAARDVMNVQPWVRQGAGGTYYHGFYNQLKQAYVSARYLYYDGLRAEGPHFSDRGVLLFDTMDYASYSLGTEKLKSAFQMAYGLLRKIAVFVNQYMRLGVQDDRVSLRSIWYEGQRREAGLRAEFSGMGNWPMQGLFWLSKDLSEEYPPGFMDSIEPEARELYEIHYHMKYRYVRLYDDMRKRGGAPSIDTDRPPHELDEIATYELNRGEFEGKTLRLLKLARCALTYLSLAVHVEERLRMRREGPQGAAFPLDILDDSMKI